MLAPLAMKGSHYDVLEVPPFATGEQIKGAYKRLAKRTHPDLGGSAAAFEQVRSAYEVLSNPLSRRLYDRRLLASRVAALRYKSFEEFGRRVRASETPPRPRQNPRETWEEMIRQMFGYTPPAEKDVWDKIVDVIVKLNQPLVWLSRVIGGPAAQQEAYKARTAAAGAYHRPEGR